MQADKYPFAQELITLPKSLISHEELDKFDPVKQHEALSKLMQEWEEEDDDEQEQTETWEFLRKALDEDRFSNRPLFP